MKRLLFIIGVSLAIVVSGARADDQDLTRVIPSGTKCEDSRLGPAKTLNGYFPFKPPASKAAWEARKKAVREQVLVANGLWPLPEKTEAHAVIHGKIDRDGYTIEKVFFASYPGHYVCGNLYRPKEKKGKQTGKLPGVLCPHGHWSEGRFYDAGEQAAQESIKQGAEKTMAGARYPLQARCAQLARLGCVVFHYDMVGYADSQQIKHRVGFTDARAELRLQNFMGLQTYNSIRALDFLLSLPGVDPKRIGVTGASGGGTQTFILCAIDDRPAAAFPAVMVSTAMQGGCPCENCSGLRVSTGNIELAGLFAPKPLGMSGANDWTVDIETKGLPELKTLYKLYGAEDRVMAKCFKQFGHNYNQVSREVMYNWFNKHLQLGHKEPIREKDFVPVAPKDLSVFDNQFPLPKDAVAVDKLRQYMTRASDKQMTALRPKDASSLEKFRRTVGAAVHAMITDKLPPAGDVEETSAGKSETRDGVVWRKFFLARKGQKEQVPAIEARGPEFDGTVVVWIHPEGKSSLVHNGKLVPEARSILEKKAAIIAVDVFRTGELQGGKGQVVDKNFAGFTYGYNRPLLAERVHDILTAVGHARGQKDTKKVHLVGWEKAGPWVVLARAVCGKAVGRTAADLAQFRFDQITSTSDEMMLPGAVKYGGMGAFVALCAPGELFLHNHRGTGIGNLAKAAFQAADASKQLRSGGDKVAADKAITWLLR